MDGALHAPLAKLLELNLALNFLFIFLAPVIRAFALGTIEFEKAVLAHINQLLASRC